MGKRGPKPTPTAVLAARGSWRADARISAGEPQARLEAPECPEWLSDDARTAWHQLVPLLLRSGLLAQLDRNALARYCSNLALWMQCAAKANEEDGIITHDYSGDNESAHVALMLKLDDKLTKAEDRFGLNPTARASIGNTLMKDDEKPNTKARFFA